MQVLERAGVEAFQIRAMDAAVCALWAVCRHWRDPQAAIIAGVRGRAKSGLSRDCPFHFSSRKLLTGFPVGSYALSGRTVLCERS